MNTAVPWIPLTAAEHEEILAQMQQILLSRHFRNSKRYPALLEFVIRASLNGETHCLKERTLGIEVFHRTPGYDTSLDPVVRITAGEVRKRIAQFYDSEGSKAAIRIDLPSGSYVPVFHILRAEHVASEQEPVATETFPSLPSNLAPENSKSVAGQSARALNSRRTWSTGLILCLMLVLGTATWFVHQNQIQGTQLWSPVFTADRPILVVIAPAESSSVPASADGEANSLKRTISTTRRVGFSDTLAVAGLCELVGAHHRPCNVATASSVSLSDLHKTSSILVGAYNNSWTLRLLEPLRFHFGNGEITSNGAVVSTHYILDRQNHSSTSPWKLDSKLPLSKISVDYAVVGRFHSELSDSEVLVSAGLGSAGTVAASEFLVDRDKISEMSSLAPRGWDGAGVEAVLEVQVIDGHIGRSRIVASHFW